MKQLKSFSLPFLFLAFLGSCNEKAQILEDQIPSPLLTASVKTNNSHDFLDMIWPDSISQISEYIREIFEDTEGNLWFGTNGDGVCKYDGKYLQYFNVAEGFSGAAVRCIAEDADGNLWFVTDGGVSMWDGRSFKNYTTANGLPSNDCWSLLINSKGVVWVGTVDGVCQFDGQTFSKFSIEGLEKNKINARLSPYLAWCILEDEKGNIWFGMDGAGLIKYNGNSYAVLSQKDGLTSDDIYSIFEDSDGKIWLGTVGDGVFRYDGEQFSNFTTEDGLANNSIWAITEDKAGNIWFGTGGGGASKYDGKTFMNFTEQKGNTKNHIQSINQDKHGNLWFGFSGGLYQFDGEEFINVQKKDLVDGC